MGPQILAVVASALARIWGADERKGGFNIMYLCVKAVSTTRSV